MRIFLLLMVCAASVGQLNLVSQGAELHVLTWANYLPKEVVQDFEKVSGTTVRVSTYDTNESLYDKLKDTGVPCDVCVPSDYMVATLIEEEQLQPLTMSRIPNAQHLDKQFLKLYFDPENKYSVPFLWGTAGIGFNKQQVPNVDSWAVLFDASHSGKVSMLDDARECFAVALKSLGRSVNETESSWLTKATSLLEKQKPLVQRYESGEFVELLTSGQVSLAHGYSGELATLAAREPEKFGYVVPKEGSTVAVDNLCIPQRAGNAAGAHAFIDFLTQPEVAARIVNKTGYASANETAKSQIEPSILGNKGVYPSQDTLKRCEYIKELGESGGIVGESSTRIDEVWKRIRGQ
jgi:spermidine/putrescine transport system substrate-binding protein